MMPIALRASMILAVAVALPTAALADTRHPQKQPVEINWLGHAAFEIVSSGGTRLLIDPFLKGNSATPEEWKDLGRYAPTAILVTHAHGDHMGQAVELSRLSGAPVVATYDLAKSLGLPNAIGMQVGGTIAIGDVKIHMVPAVHGSAPDGRPVGYVVTFADGRTLYHTGDTWITWDMSFVQTFYRPDILLTCVGGGAFTQDPETAAYEAKTFFRPSVIVPMHYGTWPGLATEAEVRKAFRHNRALRVMTPGVPQAF